jgi:hypothetical protein
MAQELVGLGEPNLPLVINESCLLKSTNASMNRTKPKGSLFGELRKLQIRSAFEQRREDKHVL